jgi:hypothetical protein
MYITLAQVYDRLMQDVDYPAIADRAEAIFGSLVRAESCAGLDAARAAGLELAGRGYA